jgi:hypothetical protein
VFNDAYLSCLYLLCNLEMLLIWIVCSEVGLAICELNILIAPHAQVVSFEVTIHNQCSPKTPPAKANSQLQLIFEENQLAGLVDPANLWAYSRQVVGRPDKIPLGPQSLVNCQHHGRNQTA